MELLWDEPPTQTVWKRKPIFWRLIYWQELDVCRCIDSMHVEKNVGETILGTLLKIKDKKKIALTHDWRLSNSEQGNQLMGWRTRLR